MLVNTIFLASLGFLTLPLYTITVQMGGDFKAQLLSEEIVQNADRIHSLKASLLLKALIDDKSRVDNCSLLFKTPSF